MEDQSNMADGRWEPSLKDVDVDQTKYKSKE